MLTTLRASANYVKQGAWHTKHKVRSEVPYQNRDAETELFRRLHVSRPNSREAYIPGAVHTLPRTPYPDQRGRDAAPRPSVWRRSRPALVRPEGASLPAPPSHPVPHRRTGRSTDQRPVLPPARGVRQAREGDRPRHLRPRRRRRARLVGRAGAHPAGLADPVQPGPRRQQRAVLHLVRRRHAQRLVQLPRPARERGPRGPGRLPLARRGRRGAGPDLRRAPGRRAAPGQRAEVTRRAQG